MTLTWHENTLDNAGVLHDATSDASTEHALKLAISECVEKSAQLMHLNIVDESQLMMYGWDPIQATLTVVMTDISKQHDSVHTCRCVFPSLSQQLAEAEQASSSSQAREACTQNVALWIKDYLTTCSTFMNFSLVALFHTGDRQASSLL